MTYPYGTKGAPTVGNGLGGLPRRAVATATEVVASETQILQRTGSVVQAATGVQGITIPTFGRILGDTPGTAVFKYYSIDGGGNTIYQIAAVNYSDSGIVSALTVFSYGTNNTNWITFEHSSSWSAGDSVYWTGTNSNINRAYISSGSNVAATTVKSTSIPASGTLTVDGSAYTLNDNFSSRAIGDNNATSCILAQKMSNGNVLIVRFATVGANIHLVGFVLNSVFDIVRSFSIKQAVTGTTSVGRIAMILPVLNATDVFSVFCFAGSTGTSAWTSSATFNANTGSVTASHLTATSVPDQNWISTSTYIINSDSVSVIFNRGNTDTRIANFPINSDLSVVNNSAPSLTFFVQNGATTMPRLRFYDFEFQDYVGLNDTSISPLDASISGTGTGSFQGRVNVLQRRIQLDYTSASATANFSSLLLSSLIVIESDPDSGAVNTGNGPFPLVRVGRNSFVCGYHDRSSASSYRFNTQLLKGT